MSLYDRLADLSLTVDAVSFDRHEMATSSDMDRVTTVVELHGDGATGRGEDVTYDAEDHDPDRRPDLEPLLGEHTHRSFSDALEDLDLFPGGPPERETSRQYRRWAVESAALDLALRQADTDLATALDRRYDPVRFVVSTRLGDPPTADRVRAWLDIDPTLSFKLDPTTDWAVDLVADLAATDAVRILDLKGLYEGTEVDTDPDPELYELVVEGFPDAVVEDPALTDETRPVLADAEERVSWDYPITGVESVEALPFEPQWLNVKPSRFGRVEALLDTIEYALERDVNLYGGGQFECGVGREHLHALASLFYPDAPNDVAPTGYNAPEPRPGLPSSPLPPPSDARGLGWRPGEKL
ncbi:hypothetical protein ACFQH6_15505 [Halobacteriaceae archaeon GCM10025711]